MIENPDGEHAPVWLAIEKSNAPRQIAGEAHDELCDALDKAAAVRAAGHPVPPYVQARIVRLVLLCGYAADLVIVNDDGSSVYRPCTEDTLEKLGKLDSAAEAERLVGASKKPPLKPIPAAQTGSEIEEFWRKIDAGTRAREDAQERAREAAPEPFLHPRGVLVQMVQFSLMSLMGIVAAPIIVVLCLVLFPVSLVNVAVDKIRKKTTN